jgi:hypothetical protein
LSRQRIEYAHSTQSLFFTSILANAVQRVRLTDLHILSPGFAHKHSVSLFSLSAYEKYLVSADTGDGTWGPTFVLKRLNSHGHVGSRTWIATRNRTTIPDCVAFYPRQIDRNKEHVFVVCFRSGSIVLCDMLRRSQSRLPWCTYSSKSENKAARVDFVGTSVHSGHREQTGMPTITGAAWIPVSMPFLVTVGQDSRCSVVDWSLSRPKVIHRFRLRAPATALAVEIREPPREIRGHERALLSSARLAIGFSKGIIAICNGLGIHLMQYQHCNDPQPLEIRALEWKRGRPPNIKSRHRQN